MQNNMTSVYVVMQTYLITNFNIFNIKTNMFLYVPMTTIGLGVFKNLFQENNGCFICEPILKKLFKCQFW